MNDRILDYDTLRAQMDVKTYAYDSERMMYFTGIIWACALLDAITPEEFGRLYTLNYKKHFDYMAMAQRGCGK